MGDPQSLATETEVGVVVLEDEPLPGLADRYAELAAGPTDAAAALRQHALDADLPLPGGRGVPEAFSWIVDRLSRRRTETDLGEHPVEVEWLALHVPPRGSASLKVRSAQEGEGGVQLKLLGSGFGSGRTVRLGVATDYQQREQCMRVLQRVDVRVHAYELGDDHAEASRDVRADVVRVRGTAVVPWEDCPLCGIAASDLDPFEHEVAGESIDLRADDKGQRRSETFEIESRDELEVGLSLTMPGVGGITSGVIARRVLSLLCEVEYAVPGRLCLTPVKLVGASSTLPFWAVGEWAGSMS